MTVKYIENQLNSKSEQVRKNIIFNIPGLIQVWERKFWNQINMRYLSTLLKDNSLEVRLLCVKILPEIIKFLGATDGLLFLKSPLDELMKEQQFLIVFQTLNQLPSLVETLSKQNGTTGEEQKNSLFFILMNLYSIIESNYIQATWRLADNSLNMINLLGQKYFELEDLSEKFGNILLEILKKGNASIRKTAAKTMIIILKTLISGKQRDYLITQLNSQLFAGPTFRERQAYLCVCKCVFNSFSRQFIQNNQFYLCMNLCSDQIPIVRRKLAELLPDLRKSIFFNDQENLDNFDNCIKVLSKDKDQDVSSTARNAEILILENEKQYEEENIHQIDNHRQLSEDLLERGDKKEEKQHNDDEDQLSQFIEQRQGSRMFERKEKRFQSNIQIQSSANIPSANQLPPSSLPPVPPQNNALLPPSYPTIQNAGRNSLLSSIPLNIPQTTTTNQPQNGFVSINNPLSTNNNTNQYPNNNLLKPPVDIQTNQSRSNSAGQSFTNYSVAPSTHNSYSNQNIGSTTSLKSHLANQIQRK